MSKVIKMIKDSFKKTALGFFISALICMIIGGACYGAAIDGMTKDFITGYNSTTPPGNTNYISNAKYDPMLSAGSAFLYIGGFFMFMTFVFLGYILTTNTKEMYNKLNKLTT